MTTTAQPLIQQGLLEGHPDLTPTNVPAWMSIDEARGVFAAAGRHSVLVSGHEGLIGLITIEALAGAASDRDSGATSIASVMDWHLVHVAPDADEATTLHAFATAARTWLNTRADLDETRKGPSALLPPASGLLRS